MQCLQCGKCCLGLDWTFNFEAPDEDPTKLSAKIMGKAVERMNSYGIFYHELKSAEKKEGWLSLTFSVGVCQNLDLENGKAHCRSYETRSAACRNYFCEKARKKEK